MDVMTLDKQIQSLINDINSASNISVNELLKAKVSFQLTKINFGLKLINRVMHLYSLQETIEDRLLNEDLIRDMSIRELLVMSSVNGKRLDNYYSKMDKILGSLNLRDLENSLLMISELDSQKDLETRIDSGDGKNLTNLSMKLLSTISQSQTLQAEIGIDLLDQVSRSMSSHDEEDGEFVPVNLNDGSLEGFQLKHALDHDQLVNSIENFTDSEDFDIDLE